MANLGRLEQRLNEDPALLQKFMADPVGLLRREGLTLSFKQQSDLRGASHGGHSISRRFAEPCHRTQKRARARRPR